MKSLLVPVNFNVQRRYAGIAGFFKRIEDARRSSIVQYPFFIFGKMSFIIGADGVKRKNARMIASRFGIRDLNQVRY